MNTYRRMLIAIQNCIEFFVWAPLVADNLINGSHVYFYFQITSSQFTQKETDL